LLHQTAYTKKIFKKYDISECNPEKNPVPRDLNLSLMDSSDEVDKDTQYVKGYIRIRDLGFANSFLSRYLHKPGEKHLQAAGPSTSMFYDI